MKKIIITASLAILATNGFAENSGFQQFQNEYNLGYEFTQMTLINGQQQVAPVNQQSINLEVEHLFDMGIWADANLNMVTYYSQPSLGHGYLNGGYCTDSQACAVGQNPFMYSFNLKGGYAFSLLNDKLQLTPYVMAGRNANWAASTVVANGYKSAVSDDFFITGGLGLRVGYRFDEKFMLYADQLYSYNWDQSGAVKAVQTEPTMYGKSYAATNYQFTTTLGARYNVTKDFQVGVSGFWNNYQHQSNIAGLVYIPQNTFGEMLSVGLTY